MESTTGKTAISGMSGLPLISMLMPAHNAEEYIAEAIHSILSQDHLNWELLILNDASTDRTAEIIAGFSDQRITIFHHEKNQGYLLSCNELVEKANGDFITFLDADDRCPKNRLSLCLQQFENDPTLDFLTTNHHRISVSGETMAANVVDVNYTRYSSDSSYHPTICCATAFVRKELLRRVGGYQPFFKNIGGEDYFWLWELSKIGKGKHLKHALYDYRSHAAQTSKNHENELSLFLPELLGALRSEFLNSAWDDTTAKDIESRIRNQFSASAFELSLRQAQRSLNGIGGSFGRHTSRCLVKIRSLKQLRAFLYLLYSWLIRKGRSAGQ